MQIDLGSLFFVFLIAAFIGLLIWLSTIERPRQLRQAWSELAFKTGLSFESGEQPFSSLENSKPPSISGEYRSRRLIVTKVVTSRSAGDVENVAVVYTKISLPVVNPMDFSLQLEGKVILLDRLVRKGIVASGDQDFDRHFTAKGSPPEFVQRALERMVFQKQILIEHPEGVIMVTNDSFSWTSWSRPSIELKGSHLIGKQSGVLTDVQLQIAFLDLLCDLAELTEQMQSQVVS